MTTTPCKVPAAATVVGRQPDKHRFDETLRRAAGRGQPPLSRQARRVREEELLSVDREGTDGGLTFT